MQKREGEAVVGGVVPRGPVRSYWTWYVSASFYRFLYLQPAYRAIDDLIHGLAKLGHPIKDEIIADCGCGPGVVAEKLLPLHPRKIYAIDSNPAMIWRVERIKEKIHEPWCIYTLHDYYTGDTLPYLNIRILNGKGFDIIYFKNSLYVPWEEATRTLRSAWDALANKGVIVIVHPEKSLSRYAFGEGYAVESHTAWYLFNRLISQAQEEYEPYTKDELFSLAAEALPGAPVTFGGTTQRSFNIVFIQKLPGL